MSEKPLHVQVAEALGWKRREGNVYHHGHVGLEWDAPGESVRCQGCHPRQVPPPYDTDWSVTGPLIEKYHFEVLPPGQHGDDEEAWLACKHVGFIPVGLHGKAYSDYREKTGTTPLDAVCRLIVVLAAEGKLEAK